MSSLDFERKHAEDLQRLSALRLLDDDFMNKVFEDKGCAEFLLQDYPAEKRFEGSVGACAARDEKSAGTLGTAGHSGG